MRTVYHGSYTAIDEIDLSKCKIGRDFGQGFYVTCIRSQAEFWAKRIDSMVFHTDNDVLQALMTDFNFSELEAINKYYKSKTYTLLADNTTDWYKKTWQEIYEILKRELKID